MRERARRVVERCSLFTTEAETSAKHFNGETRFLSFLLPSFLGVVEDICFLPLASLKKKNAIRLQQSLAQFLGIHLTSQRREWPGSQSVSVRSPNLGDDDDGKQYFS